MKRKLIIKAYADLDAAGHYEYLLERNAAAAARFRQGVKAAYNRIRVGYASCPPLALPEYQHLELRFCRVQGFDSYFVVFQVVDDALFAVRLLHSSQDTASALRGTLPSN